MAKDDAENSNGSTKSPDNYIRSIAWPPELFAWINGLRKKTGLSFSAQVKLIVKTEKEGADIKSRLAELEKKVTSITEGPKKGRRIP